jgi:FSR family fosmidomycin resistance protein-like MFS transporter
LHIVLVSDHARQNVRDFAGTIGLVIALTSVGNVSSIFVPFILGNIADAIGLQSAMWLLALGPIALLIGLPRK